MTPDRWAATATYLGEVFGGLGEPLDDQLATLMDRGAAAGLPRIAVSADVGRLLMVLASLVSGPGGGRAVEVGTLGGYSGLWIARGLGPGGRLTTIEAEPKHAAFARAEFERAGRRVELREGTGLEVLPRLVEELGPASCDMVFLDAIKSEYRAYAEHAAMLLRPGGLLVADNCLGSHWWITDPAGVDPARDAVDAFNRWLGSPASGFLACCVANREGLAVARRS
jgi:predicted O-methyltransferase YrrM